MRAAIVCCLALAGCYRSSEPVASEAAPPPESRPPRVAWSGDAFQTARLPAVSADGRVVLIAIRDKDGARGLANLRLELRDRSGAALAKHVALTVEEAEQIAPDAIGDRAAAANRWLADQHRARNLVPLRVLEVQPGDGIASAHRAARGDLSADWRANRFVVEQGHRTLLVRETPADWLAKPRSPSSAGPCANPAFLGGAAVSVEHRIAVLTIAYGGTDLCWEPDDTQHVIAWGASSGASTRPSSIATAPTATATSTRSPRAAPKLAASSSIARAPPRTRPAPSTAAAASTP